MYLIVGLLEDCPTEEGIQAHRVEELDYTRATYERCQENFAIWALFHPSPRTGVLTPAHKTNSIHYG